MQTKRTESIVSAAGAWRRRALVASLILTGSAASAVEVQYHVSQKDQIFTPGDMTIHRGETIEIVNDDGDLLHHLYVDAKQFQFDSGDQEPGAKVDITFPARGRFDVLCGIHPKMKLSVRVE